MSEPARLPVQREADQSPSILRLISEAMAQPGFDVAIMREMLAMYREQQAKDALRAYVADMTLAQGEMRAVLRDAENTQTHSRYARLETIDALIRPIYTKYGFALSFNHAEAKAPGNVRVSCACMHRDGHVEHFDSPEAPPDMYGARGVVNKTPLHGMGSTISYQRRYLTVMIFNVALTNEDDDGNGASNIRNIADGMGENIQRRPATPREVPMGEWLTRFAFRASTVGTRAAAEKLLTSEGTIRAREILEQRGGDELAKFDELTLAVLNKFADPPKDDDVPTDPDKIPT